MLGRRIGALALACAVTTSACRCARTPAGKSDHASSAPVSGAGPASGDRGAAKDHDLPLEKLKLPPGFQVDVYAAHVKNARSMALTPRGTLFVGTRTAGKVFAIPNADQNAFGDRVIEIADDLEMPNGVAFAGGALYVAEISRVLRFDAIEDQLDHPPKPVVLPAKFPTDKHHGWKFIAIGPDGKLYVPVGAPCNICRRDEPVYASITRMNLDGGGQEVFARGIRNTVGFAWHPSTHELWFTDNGRDMLGDDMPPDELNHAPSAGLDFGYPYCHGRAIADPEFGGQRSCGETKAPAAELGPHVAALGMRFYTGDMFPPAYKNQIFIAEHGSWNRSKKIGYRVMRVRIEGDRGVEYEPFVTGWLQGETVWGRPVDVQVMPDGALLISDDEADAIYRVSYAGPAAR